MAQVNSSNENPSTRKRAGVQQMLKHNMKLDMTPMVDLGFLLITFFVITTELNKPTMMNLIMPKDGGEPTQLGDSFALTFLLGKNNTVYYYNGQWEEAVNKKEVFETTYSGKDGLRKVIIEKQQRLEANKATNKEGRDGLMMLIKPTAASSYQNVVNMLDETTISAVKKYAVVKLSPEEIEFLKRKEQ